MSTVWTDALVDEVKRLLADKYTARQVAEKLNLPSRNSVISICHRRGIELNRRPKSISGKRRYPPKTSLTPRTTGRAIGAQASGITRAIANRQKFEQGEEASDIDLDACPNRVTLFAAQSWHCRWPAADDGSAKMVCGDPVTRGSWCERHNARGRVRRTVAAVREANFADA